MENEMLKSDDGNIEGRGQTAPHQKSFQKKRYKSVKKQTKKNKFPAPTG